jgi:hypothetical protein
MAKVWTGFSDFVLDQVFGYQSAVKLKQNTEVLAAQKLRTDLGGHRENGVQSSSGAADLDPYNYRDATIDATDAGGLSARARLEVRCENATTTVTPKIWNMSGTPAVHVAGSLSSSTSWVEQLLTMTPLASAEKKYRLRLTVPNTTYPVYGLGVVEQYA